ncbi:hypothetical protein B0H14DRAFT_2812161, partial [Mycena olivaceomarginata]
MIPASRTTRGSYTGRLPTHVSRTARVLCARDPHPRISGSTPGLCATRLLALEVRLNSPASQACTHSDVYTAPCPYSAFPDSEVCPTSQATHAIAVCTMLALHPHRACISTIRRLHDSAASARLCASCIVHGKGAHSPRQHRVKICGGALHASQASSAQRRSFSSPRSAGYEAAPSACGDVRRASRPSPRLGWRSGTPSVVSAQCPPRGWGSTRSVRG